MPESTKHFTDTIFYQIELTARYTKMLGTQLFGKLGVGLTIEEFSTLDTILANSELCQREIILKDRANTGKLLDVLEAKGLVKRELTVKNNRPVKIVTITKKGKDTYNEIYELFSNSSEFFDVKRILKLLNEHKNGKRDNSRKIWTIYTFLIWYQEYFVKR